MSTRALYTFKANGPHEQDWNVYKHSDGYPTGAARTLQITLDWFAWKLPRYESDEFAAAFCAAAKCDWFWNPDYTEGLKSALKEYGPKSATREFRGGNARLMPQGEPLAVATTNCSDIDFRYEISLKEGTTLWVAIYRIDCKFGDSLKDCLLFECKQSEFEKEAKLLEAKAAE